MYFDSHAHLSSPETLPLIDGIMQRAKMAHVTQILNICTDPLTLKEGLELEKKFPNIRNAGATTPHDVEKEGEEVFPLFRDAAQAGQLAAVGETGLEYFYKELNRKTQQKFLIRYLHLAQECKLPVIFHCREAFADLFSIADAEYAKGAPAILHCFTGTLQEAEEVFARGWHLSFSGIVTFKKSDILREVAKMAPLSQLLIETDTPYLAPQSKRGRPNEPSFLPETAQIVAKARGISVETLAQATFENARALFQM
ncbi:MAG: TatD family hydrolase [Verrucomicrobia bacterium]|nr:TatD family hydrolase [Verrucomicrobiota bacterium]MBU6446729.1 TatD family hydrolase [Verrucomicrobiota bacterium]MDE3047729.1 TatD family hydrolase [Verrucomicrobiota bacterium]